AGSSGGARWGRALPVARDGAPVRKGPSAGGRGSCTARGTTSRLLSGVLRARGAGAMGIESVCLAREAGAGGRQPVRSLAAEPGGIGGPKAPGYGGGGIAPRGGRLALLGLARAFSRRPGVAGTGLGDEPWGVRPGTSQGLARRRLARGRAK